MRLGHGQNDPVSKAFLRDGCPAQDREDRCEVLHAPGFPLAIPRRKKWGQADLEIGIETASNLPQFSDGNAVESPELIGGAQRVGPVAVYTPSEDPCTCLYQRRARKQDIRPGHFR